MKKTFLIKTFFVLLLTLAGYVGQTHAATFYIWPSSGTYAPGSTQTVYVGVNTQGQASNAADMVLTYNPSQLEILSVSPGNAYEGYLAPAYGSGTVRLTAYSVGSTLNGKATFASVKFKSKPGVTSASLGFSFSPGSTTDSNVAGPNSGDILSGVGGATYTFSTTTQQPKTTTTATTKVEKEPEPKDEEAPVVTVPESEQESYDGDLQFTVEDKDSGIFLQTLRITLGEDAYTKDSEFIRIEGDEKKIEVLIRGGNLEPGTETPVKIEVRDNEGNWIKPVEFSYLTAEPEEEEEVPVEPAPCPELKPVAIEKGYPIDWYVLLIGIVLILLSAGYITYKEIKMRKNTLWHQ